MCKIKRVIVFVLGVIILSMVEMDVSYARPLGMCCKLKQTSATTKSATFKWSYDEKDVVDRYLIELSRDNAKWLIVGETSGKKYTVNDLESGESYWVRVTPKNKEKGCVGEAFCIVTKPKSGVDTDYVEIYKKTKTSCWVKWRKVTGANWYKVYYTEKSTGVTYIKQTNKSRVKLSGLPEGSKWRIKVKACRKSPSKFIAER